MTTARKLPGNVDCFLQHSPQLFKQYYIISKVCELRYAEMKFLPALYQNLNELELCSFSNTLSQTPVTQTHQHLLIIAEQRFRFCWTAG